jgi:hypothetical protein
MAQTESWRHGAFHYPELSQRMLKLLEPYKPDHHEG